MRKILCTALFVALGFASEASAQTRRLRAEIVDAGGTGLFKSETIRVSPSPVSSAPFIDLEVMTLGETAFMPIVAAVDPRAGKVGIVQFIMVMVEAYRQTHPGVAASFRVDGTLNGVWLELRPR